jgi:outer membrane beta-barrel protein
MRTTPFTLITPLVHAGVVALLVHTWASAQTPGAAPDTPPPNTPATPAGVAPATVPAAPAPAPAPTAASRQTADEQVIVPQVERREIRRPRFPSNDITVTFFGGSYTSQNFGSNAVSGVRLGYHITENFFVEGAWGRTKLNDEAFRQILPGGVFANPNQKLTYYHATLGYNLLNGESFFGSTVAKLTQGYVVLGGGSTKIAELNKPTVVLGFGMRLVLNDWFVVQADFRQHLFTLDLLGKRQNTRNPEASLGFTVTF